MLISLPRGGTESPDSRLRQQRVRMIVLCFALKAKREKSSEGEDQKEGAAAAFHPLQRSASPWKRVLMWLQPSAHLPLALSLTLLFRLRAQTQEKETRRQAPGLEFRFPLQGAPPSHK